MTKASSAVLQARAEKVAAIIRASSGMDRNQVAEAMGLTVRSIHDALTLAKRSRLGIADVRTTSHTVMWVPTETASEYAAEMLRRHKARKTAQNIRRWENEKRRRLQKVEEWFEADGAIQRVVPALKAGPLPFRCVAANSVFSWRPAA